MAKRRDRDRGRPRGRHVSGHPGRRAAAQRSEASPFRAVRVLIDQTSPAGLLQSASELVDAVETEFAPGDARPMGRTPVGRCAT